LLRYALIIFLPVLYIFLVYADGLLALADFSEAFGYLFLLGLYCQTQVIVGFLQLFFMVFEPVLLQQFRLGNPFDKHVSLSVQLLEPDRTAVASLGKLYLLFEQLLQALQNIYLSFSSHYQPFLSARAAAD
jgi:hypothetical protein